MQLRARALLVLLLPTVGSCTVYVSRHADAGDRHFKEHKYREAISEYAKAARFAPDNFRLIRSLGFSHYELAQYTDAFTYLSKAAVLQPADPEVRVRLGNIYLIDNRPKDALAEAEYVLRFNPTNVDALNVEGSVYLRDGRSEKAADVFRKIDELAPTSPLGPYQLGLTALATGRRAEAVQQFERALARSPDHLGALTKLVETDIADNRADDAYDRLAKQTAARAPSAPVLDLVGAVQSSRGQLESAERAFLEAIALDPKLASPRTRLAALI